MGLRHGGSFILFFMEYKIFEPDFSDYNKLICLDGTPVNELDVVRKSSAYSNLLQDVLTPVQVMYDDSNISESELFDSIIPKEVQSDVEIMDYMNYLKDDVK